MRPAVRRAAPNKLDLIIDSGCATHCHNMRDDLINLRAVDESIVDISGVSHLVTSIGDLPLIVFDVSGFSHELLILGVRHVPSISATLVSAERLFESSNAAALFGRCEMRLPIHGGFTSFPIYKAADGLYVWPVEKSNVPA